MGMSALLLLAMIGAIALSFGSGSRPERYAALVLVAAVVFDLAYHAAFGVARYHRIDLGHLLIDSLSLAGFLAVSLRANRVWPLWCCSVQMIGVIAHLTVIARPQGDQRAYWLMTTIPAQASLVFLALGTLAHINRKARIGPYRDWRLH